MFRTLSEHEAAAVIADLGKNGKVDVVMHMSPDADTTGCALAVMATLNENGGDAVCVCSDPVPEYLRFLPGSTDVRCELREDAERISVDVASPAQLGRFSEVCGTFRLQIDHHGRGEIYADNTVDADAAACGEIVFRILRILADEYGMRIPTAAFTYLYAAISGDTGSFRFANTTEKTHMIAAELHSMGADTVWAAHNLHAVKTRGALAARRIGLRNMKYLCHDRLAVTSATISEMEEGGVGAGDFSEADEMRSAMGVYVGVSLRECEPGVWRASTRANVDIDCSAVCGQFGGGGHKGAAGCTLRNVDREAAVAAMESAFGMAIEEYEKRTGIGQK